MAEDWTEKYRPQHLVEVMGNPKAVGELRKWAEHWEAGAPKKRGVILAGDAGIGKTSAALALARDMGWGVIELNASDVRNAESIRRIATTGALNETFTDEGEFISVKEGGRKLIILDEADNLFERVEGSSYDDDVSDRGGKRAIIETVTRTAQPVVLIVNDYYALTRGSGVRLKSLCQTIRFKKVSKPSVRKRLADICKKEGIRISPRALDIVAEHSGGDMRSAVNDLQSLSNGRKEIREGDTDSLGYRDTARTIWDAVRGVLKSTSARSARESLRDLDETPDFILQWIGENLPLEYRKPEDLVRGYEAISRADVFLGRTRRRQHYRMWAYASDMMSAGVAVAKRERYGGYVKYQFPSWLLRMSRSREDRGTRKSVAGKIGGHCHISKSSAMSEVMPTFQYLFQNDKEFMLSMALKLDMEGAEVGWLLADKADAHRIRHVMDEITELKEKAATSKVSVEEHLETQQSGGSITAWAEEPEAEKQPEKEKEDEGPKQKNLFDFN